VLDEIVRSLGAGDQAWQGIQLGRELHDLADTAGDDADVELGLADISALVHDRLAGRPTRASFRTGTLTVCTLVPMRSVPHRVVCLLGMDDGAFPRQAIADGDDVLARDPRSGERDPRSEDRQLFLDAICAAQEHLVVSYTGADPRSGAPVPPCVPLGELMDAIDATALAPDSGPVSTHVVTHHPLQPFDERNFVSGELGVDRPFSYDRLAVAGARAAAGRRHAPAPLVAAPLVATETETVQLDELVMFFQQPTRGFLRQRLGVATSSRDEDPDDALTIELAPLAGWAIGDRVLRSCLAGLSRGDAARLEYLRGQLPPGPLGSEQMRVIGGRIDALLTACEVERQDGPTALDVAVQLSDGRSLSGTVSGVRGSAILEVTYSTLKAKQRIAAWLRYLALVATTGRTDLRGVTVGRLRNDARRSIVTGLDASLAVQVLDLLVDIRDRGLREPLPLALDTSADYATRRHRGSAIDDSLPPACRIWEAGNFPERDDPEHVLVYGPSAPFDVLTAQRADGDDVYPGEPTRFGALARLVWDPLLTVETDVLP
jgi:exodeoxyribonuclease V gamma subunit